MLVPLDGFNVVHLSAGANLTLDYDRKRISVEEFSAKHAQTRVLRISGKAEGVTLLRAKKGGRTYSTLTIHVRSKIAIGFAFHLVHHLTDSRATDVDEKRLKKIVEYANQIWEPQANVSILNEYQRTLRATHGPPTHSLAFPEKDTFVKFAEKHRIRTVSVNVFFFDEIFKMYSRGIYEPGTAYTYRFDVAIAKRTHKSDYQYARALAHELTHIIGPDSDRSGDGISLVGDGEGTKIYLDWLPMIKI
jgi:hypothetical protein